MKTIVKCLIGGALFFVCVLIGYFATMPFIGNDKKEEEKVAEKPKIEVKEDSSEPASSPVASTTIVVSDSSDAIPPVPVLQEPAEPLTIASTEVKKNGDLYSLQVICTNVPVNVVIEYEIPDLHQKNTDGYFSRIPGCKSGSYKINVTNSANGEVLASKVVYGFKLPEEKPVERMSSGEFQLLLLKQSDNSLLGGKHPKVAKYISLSFEGLRDDDRKPGDILAVREKIAYGIWSSAKVIWVGYDESGKINSARIQPVY